MTLSGWSWDRKKERIKIGAETGELKHRKTIQKIKEMKSWLFEKIKSVDKPPARLNEKKREDTKYQYQQRIQGYHCRAHTHRTDNKAMLQTT